MLANTKTNQKQNIFEKLCIFYLKTCTINQNVLFLYQTKGDKESR